MFTCPDVLWEKYAAWSSYHYCRNNPISKRDVTGMDEEQRLTAVANARASVGIVKYSWGGKNYPNLDCSGFTTYLAGKSGENIDHGVTGQENSLTDVGLESMQEGNFYTTYDDSGGHPHHIGVITGIKVINGKTVITITHSSSSKKGAVTTSFTVGDGSWWDRNRNKNTQMGYET